MNSITSLFLAFLIALSVQGTPIIRNIEEPEQPNTTIYLVVTKMIESDIRGQSTLEDFLLTASSSNNQVDPSLPQVRSFSNIGIGYAVDMNNAALEQVQCYETKWIKYIYVYEMIP